MSSEDRAVLAEVDAEPRPVEVGTVEVRAVDFELHVLGLLDPEPEQVVVSEASSIILPAFSVPWTQTTFSGPVGLPSTEMVTGTAEPALEECSVPRGMRPHGHS